MFSQGHLIWVAISLVLISGGLFYLIRRKPPLKRVLKCSLWIGVLSEVVKVLSVAQIVPMVDPVITSDGTLAYVPTGEYTPYIGMEHMPLELCSLYLLFLLLANVLKDSGWKRGLYAVMFASGTVGGILGILLASIAGDFTAASEYFTAPRAWQYFLFHAMIVTVSIYLGYSRESGLISADYKKALLGLLLLDLPTFYLNSIFSSEVYLHDQAAGVTHRINFFSSYVNPVGLILTEKWQWIVYLCIRLILAAVLIRVLYLPLHFKERRMDSHA